MPLIRNRGVDLFYDLSGPEDGPAVAFSNSIGTTLEMWDRQIPALTSRYRCLRYDTRGHGRSPTVDEPVAIEDLADDLAGLLDALGLEEAHIVGLSLGGMTAQAFGQRHATRAKSIVLMATSAYCLTGGMSAPRSYARKVWRQSSIPFWRAGSRQRLQQIIPMW